MPETSVCNGDTGEPIVDDLRVTYMMWSAMRHMAAWLHQYPMCDPVSMMQKVWSGQILCMQAVRI